MDQFKQAFSNVFPRDLRSVEPSKKGLLIGEDVRIYDEPAGAVVRFLKGTGTRRRQEVKQRLDGNNLQYSVGDDFSN